MGEQPPAPKTKADHRAELQGDDRGEHPASKNFGVVNVNTQNLLSSLGVRKTKDAGGGNSSENLMNLLGGGAGVGKGMHISLSPHELYSAEFSHATY